MPRRSSRLQASTARRARSSDANTPRNNDALKDEARKETVIAAKASLSSPAHDSTKPENDVSTNKVKVSTAPASDEAPCRILMILSPAKTLNLEPLPESQLDSLTLTQPHYCQVPEKSQQIADLMKQQTPAQLAKLLSLSNNLASKAHGYWENFQIHQHDDDKASSTTTINQQNNNPPKTCASSKPCAWAFHGPAYQGLAMESASIESISYLQQHLRIVDPLYGLLRPLDVIQPYRLEMATSLALKGGSSTKLSTFWKSYVTQQLLQEFTSHQSSPTNNNFTPPILLNIASDEYSSAVDPASLLSSGVRFIKVVFQHGGRVVAVHAKRARGLFARYMADRQCTTIADIQGFDAEGYRFQSDQSNEATLVFNRPPNWKQASKVNTKRSTNTKATTFPKKTRR